MVDGLTMTIDMQQSRQPTYRETETELHRTSSQNDERELHTTYSYFATVVRAYCGPPLLTRFPNPSLVIPPFVLFTISTLVGISNPQSADMLDRIQLPLRPAGTSLAAHVAALDLLATRLDSLPLRSHWPARIPINSKASFDGDIVHTNQLKVNVGGEWWVEMTAPEAANYVRRRRAREFDHGVADNEDILEEHARVLEGKPRANDEPTDVDVDMVSDERPYRSLPSIQFDPLFAHPVQEQASSSQNAVVTQAEQTSPLEGTKEVAWQNVSSQSEGAEQGALPESLQMLVDMVSKMSPGQEQNEVRSEFRIV